MPASPQAATLLVLTSQATEAERLIAALRTGGLAVRGAYSINPDRIQDLAERRACDLVVCLSYDPELDLEKILARYREVHADIPLLVLAERQDAHRVRLQALRAGARDVVERDDSEHLQLVVARELSDLQQRRQSRRLNRRLQLCELHARKLVDSSPEAVAFVHEGMHIQANGAYLALFGYATLNDLQSVPFLDLIRPEQQQAVRDFLREQEQSDPQEAAALPIEATRADASRFHATLQAAPSEIDGESCLCLTLRETKAAPPLVWEGEPTPPLQGSLPGFAALIAELDARLGPSGRPARPFALVYIRIRGCANLIREMGLTRGLARIGALATPLARICGNLGTLMRVNDDGFALIANDQDEAALDALAERIRSDVRLPEGSGPKLRAETVCEVGYVLASTGAYGAAELFDAAFQTCCYGSAAAKAAERPKPTSLATRAKQASETGDGAMTAKIERALINDRFILVYQPIISLMGDAQENYSVLIRMLDEDEQLLEAQDFIGPAIRSGLIEKIDKWAIRHAIQTLGERRTAGQNLNFFINLAEDSFRDSGIIIWICDCLRELKVRGSWLTFVFQEELVEANLASLNRLAESLKKIKCRVAINRFGVSEHPQQLLQALPLDFVLLSPEFALDLADDPDKQTQLDVLSSLAREFNIKTVVTGVEDARALTVLWTAGVDYVQGNFLQRPSPTLEIGG